MLKKIKDSKMAENEELQDELDLEMGEDEEKCPECDEDTNECECSEEEMAKNPEKVTFEFHNTICKNVANRVKRLQNFAQSNDIVIFVGGKKSSNAKVLFNHCLEVNSCTVFVSNTSDISSELLQQCQQAQRVGICGATSTPKWLMEEIKTHIEHNVSKTNEEYGI